MSDPEVPDLGLRLACEDFYEAKRAVLARGATMILEQLDMKPPEISTAPRNPISRWRVGRVDASISETLPLEVSDRDGSSEYLTLGEVETHNQFKNGYFQSRNDIKSKMFFIAAYPTHAGALAGKDRDAAVISAKPFNIADLLEDATFRNLGLFHERLNRLMPLFDITYQQLTGPVLADVRDAEVQKMLAPKL
jgi:hypothetical protein